MTGRPSRRAFLAALGALASAGCTATPVTSDGTPTTDATPASDPDGATGPGDMRTATPTPVDLPADCPKSPAVSGLPDRPDELDSESATAFVERYERTLTLARNPTFTGFRRFEHVGTDPADGGYAVYLYVVPTVETPTPAGDSPTPAGDGSTPATPTPMPTPARSDSYNVGYYVDAHRVVRDARPDALTYQFAPYDGFDPRAEGELVACG